MAAVVDNVTKNKTEKVVEQAPVARRFTVSEYYQMAEAGVFGPEERVELIEGEVLKMSPKGIKHASSDTRADNCFRRRLGDRIVIRLQSPVRLSDLTEPEPDVVLALPHEKDYSDHHPAPSEILLVLEIAESSLRYDREVKSRIYAEAGIIQYCLLNLISRRLEDYRDPEDGRYRTVHTYDENQSFTLVAFPDIAVPVNELLPVV
jgi:Uma2 family endonuclease